MFNIFSFFKFVKKDQQVNSFIKILFKWFNEGRISLRFNLTDPGKTTMFGYVFVTGVNSNSHGYHT